MKPVSYAEARRACAYFFLCPGLAYGIFTSRLPALKAQTGANDAEVGLMLLALGLGSVCGLLTCGKAIRRSGSRTVLRVGSGLTILGLAACGLAPRPLVLGGICAFTGPGIGLSDKDAHGDPRPLPCGGRRGFPATKKRGAAACGEPERDMTVMLWQGHAQKRWHPASHPTTERP